MESWVPLFDIFLNSPTPEIEGSQWLQRSFNSSSSATTTTTATSTSTSSFISLLTKPSDAIVLDSSSPANSSPLTQRVMFIQTLPNMVQSRILSFLAFESKRFCASELSKLARNVLIGNGNQCEVDFWVKKAARNLFDAVSDSNFEWISKLSLDSEEERVDEEFEAVPGWLKDAVGSNELVLPWLPVPGDELNSRTLFGSCETDENMLSQVGEDKEEENMDEVLEEIEIDRPASVPLGPEIQEMAASLKARIMDFESTSKTVGLANEILQLCLEKQGDSFEILGLIEPWKADDETASVLISLISNGSEEELAWPSQALCSIILPKLLVLEKPASRVLVTATIDYCKLHQRAAVCALLFPLILRKEGINNPICDVITKIVKECLHPAHVSAFCQKLLCGGETERRFICLPCHRCQISDELVWTESLFNLFQNILSHNVHLTQDAVDHIVYRIQKLADRYSNSLKFGNFLLCLITKCSSLLKSHKLLLSESVEHTNTLVTRSILSKLASL